MRKGSPDPKSSTRGSRGSLPSLFLADPEEDGLTAETLRETVKIVGFDPVPGCRGLCAHLLPG
jgi:hypothetical protein